MLNKFMRANQKTKIPACCSYDCCGCKFGRYYRHAHRNHGQNRIIRARRYAKHSESQKLRSEIDSEIEYLKNEIREFESLMNE